MAVAALIGVGSGCCAVLGVLLLNLLGVRQLGPGRRWQGYGILLSMAGVFVIVVARARNWSSSDLREVHAAVLAVVLAGVLVLAVGLGIQAQSAMGTPEDG
jgi:hypothetical protein